MEQKAKDAQDRMAALERMRAPVDKINREVIYHIAPFLGVETGQGKGDTIDYLERMRYIGDPLPLQCMEKSTNGMYSGTTPPSRPWSRLKYQDNDLMEWGQSKDFIDRLNDAKNNRLRAGNFYSAILGFNAERLAFSTAIMLRCPQKAGMPFYRTLTWGQYWLGTDEMGNVDSLFRNVWMSARNMEGRFGRDKLSKAAKNLADKHSQKDEQIQVIHALYPRKDRDVRKVDSKNKPIESIYFEAGASDSDPGLLGESGFNRFPAYGSMWDRVGNNVYGVGAPGWKALPFCKRLQDQEESITKAEHLTLDPPTVAPTALRSMGLKTYPGGRNWIDSLDGQKAALQALFQVNFNIDHAMARKADFREAIQSLFYTDVLMMIDALENQAGRSPVTATQIIEMKADRLQQLGPFCERLENDVLDPVVMAEVDDIFRRAMTIPGLEIPQEVFGQQYLVEYEGIMAQAMKEPSVRAVDDTVMFAGQLVPIFPGAMDNIDVDAAISARAQIRGVPSKVMRGKDEVEQIRQQRAQQEAEMKEAALAQTVTQGVKDLGSVKMNPEDPNLMSQLYGAMVGEGQQGGMVQ